ncbi:mannosyltransferase putative-domain-containing protein [Thelonectria olida]|uniref:Mannosyltransferase putative-domain-containing protein n=1 Tax=Thelonectria olida TaxID=1576542 RepID=A0A9P8VU16_9HYPO|nr:mannosyltransferase putative-domain-containing protein [Thelonectria olida]
MRLALRWISFLVLAIFLLVYLYPSGTSSLTDVSTKISWPSALGGQPDIPQPPEHLVDFWRTWSHIIYNSRPQTDSPISIFGTASTLAPSEPDDARTPYRDLVVSSDEDMEQLRASHERFVGNFEMSHSNATSWFQGRGVVMVGGGEYFGPAIIGIQMLRRTGSSLPVEVFVPNEKEYEAEICENYLPKLNAKCVVLSQFQTRGSPKGLKISHYQLKAPALLLSSFAEVLLLDSDSIPLVDPSKEIFETEPYLSNGLITWPDFWRATESPQFWNITGLSSYPDNLSPFSSESGQLVINKGTHLDALLLATYYNLFGPDHYYPLLSQGALGQGDKETFMAAAVALNASHYRVKTPALGLGRYDGKTQKGTALLQYLPFDDANRSQGSAIRPAFLHSNTPKMNAGHLVDEGDLVAVDGKSRLRLLGPKSDLVHLFGFDVEDTLWDLLVQTGCELADSVREWKGRENLCERLTEHHQLVFDENPDA